MIVILFCSVCLGVGVLLALLQCYVCFRFSTFVVLFSVARVLCCDAFKVADFIYVLLGFISAFWRFVLTLYFGLVLSLRFCV